MLMNVKRSFPLEGPFFVLEVISDRLLKKGRLLRWLRRSGLHLQVVNSSPRSSPPCHQPFFSNLLNHDCCVAGYGLVLIVRK
jgi:hypothetical protein